MTERNGISEQELHDIIRRSKDPSKPRVTTTYTRFDTEGKPIRKSVTQEWHHSRSLRHVVTTELRIDEEPDPDAPCPTCHST